MIKNEVSNAAMAAGASAGVTIFGISTSLQPEALMAAAVGATLALMVLDVAEDKNKLVPWWFRVAIEFASAVLAGAWVGAAVNVGLNLRFPAYVGGVFSPVVALFVGYIFHTRILPWVNKITISSVMAVWRGK